jgi:hypothetical protein
VECGAPAPLSQRPKTSTLEATPSICQIPPVDENANAENLLRAYGPEKEAWKAAGNYFSAEELKRMEEEFSDLTIKTIPPTIYAAD